MSGQFNDPVRVVAFNTTERWSEDVSEDVAREITRRLGLAGDELPSSPLLTAISARIVSLPCGSP
jgi:hypothetical protein